MGLVVPWFLGFYQPDNQNLGCQGQVTSEMTYIFYLSDQTTSYCGIQECRKNIKQFQYQSQYLKSTEVFNK